MRRPGSRREFRVCLPRKNESSRGGLFQAIRPRIIGQDDRVNDVAVQNKSLRDQGADADERQVSGGIGSGRRNQQKIPAMISVTPVK